MANNKYNESIEDKAFKALDEALQIDFGKDNVPSRRGDAPQARRVMCLIHRMRVTSRPRKKRSVAAAAAPGPSRLPGSGLRPRQ